MNRYDYAELRAAATADGATEQAVNALGEWFERFGETLWNGEYYDADDGLRLFPVVAWDDEADQGEIIGYEFR